MKVPLSWLYIAPNNDMHALTVGGPDNELVNGIYCS
jgi:hypothetical protein